MIRKNTGEQKQYGKKCCFLDTETTGVSTLYHSPIQFAFLCEKGGLRGTNCRRETFFCRPQRKIPRDHVPFLPPAERLFWDGEDIYDNPCRCRHDYAIIDMTALDIQKRTIDEILEYPSAEDVLPEIRRFLSVDIDQFDKRDKYFVYGYNISFDMAMIYDWAQCTGYKYMGSFFFSPSIDIAALAGEMFARERTSFPNFKLGTLCNHLGLVPEDMFHDAMTDADLTMKMYYLLRAMREMNLPLLPYGGYEPETPAMLADAYCREHFKLALVSQHGPTQRP